MTVTFDAPSLSITGNSITDCGVTYYYAATIPSAITSVDATAVQWNASTRTLTINSSNAALASLSA